MATIILEHYLAGRTFDIERFNAAQRDNLPCLTLHGVRHVASYVAPDGRKMICVFEAPDAEAVRKTARRLGYSYDSIWTAKVVS